MASFFETYKETKSVSFDESWSSPATVARYTCPSGRYAYVFITAAAFYGSAGTNVVLAFYNSARTDERVHFKGVSDMSFSNQSLGMIILRPGETVYTYRDGGIPGMAVSGTMRIFEFAISTL